MCVDASQLLARESLACQLIEAPDELSRRRFQYFAKGAAQFTREHLIKINTICVVHRRASHRVTANCSGRQEI
jgi:hypothetical protein